MFSKKTLIIAGVIFLITVNIIFLSVAGGRYPSFGTWRTGCFLVAPFQKAVTHSIRFVKGIWRNYFYLVSVSKENDMLNKLLSNATKNKNRYKETELSNLRLRSLLNFKKNMAGKVIAAEVTGKDPSPWIKTIIIDKGKIDGVKKGLPVVNPEGITGQVIDVSKNYSKVLLIVDRNSAVDALVQRTRARGIIKGEFTGRCILKYVLRKRNIIVGDTIVSSGLDGVFPKGLRIGYVSETIKANSGIFHEFVVIPYVDFEKIEEVLIILNPPEHSKMAVQE